MEKKGKEYAILTRREAHGKEYREMLKQVKKCIRNVERHEVLEDIQHDWFFFSNEFSEQVKGDSKNSVSGSQQGVFSAGQY